MDREQGRNHLFELFNKEKKKSYSMNNVS